jgi:hypothetical protein
MPELKKRDLNCKCANLTRLPANHNMMWKEPGSIMVKKMTMAIYKCLQCDKVHMYHYNKDNS